MKAVLKYPGGKWSLSDWICSFFPEHHSYLEPFFGSGGVFFNKPKSDIETINDLDGNVVNLFKCIRKDPEKLARTIYMTPYARQVYEEVFLKNSKDPYEKALIFLIKLNMGYGFRTCGNRVGWKNDVQGREKSYASLDWCSLPDRIISAAERLRGVQIECRPAIDLIKRFNYKNVLIYCDPPYMLSTRNGNRKQYQHEMDNNDHEKLLDTLKAHKGYVVISGYGSDMYDSMLSEWNRFDKTVYSQVCSKKQEVIWMNFDPPCKQLTFDKLF